MFSRRHRRPVGIAITGVVALAASLAACSSSGSSAPTSSANGKTVTTVTMENNPGSTISDIGYVASKMGFFTDHGLNVKFVSVPSATLTSSLLSGSVDVATIDLNNAGPPLSNGEQLEMILGEQTNYWSFIVPKKDAGMSLPQILNSIQTVGAPSVGGSGEAFFKLLLSSYGISPTKVKVIADPDGAAFIAGKVDASMGFPMPECVEQDHGGVTAFSYLSPVKPVSSYPAALQKAIQIPEGGFWTSKSFATSNPAVVKQLQAALTQTIAWVTDNANQAKVDQMLRDSPQNEPSLTTAQFNACINSVLPIFESHFSATDATNWSAFLKNEGVAPNGLPASSQWLDSSVPSASAS
jgi:ABC-type nitrate/sulfonate/bicarbonate transport system substrate-binding protein